MKWDFQFSNSDDNLSHQQKIIILFSAFTGLLVHANQLIGHVSHFVQCNQNISTCNNHKTVKLKQISTLKWHCHGSCCHWFFLITGSKSGFILRTGLAGEYCSLTGGLLWTGKAISGKKQNLAGEFCVVAREFSNLQCLMKTCKIDVN